MTDGRTDRQTDGRTDRILILSGITRVTDGRTDRQTDGRTDRILIARPRLHFMQRGKNQCLATMAAEPVVAWSLVLVGPSERHIE